MVVVLTSELRPVLKLTVHACVGLLALTVDESDEAFANVYSGAVSLQNLMPRVPQRLLVGATVEPNDQIRLDVVKSLRSISAETPESADSVTLG